MVLPSLLVTRSWGLPWLLVTASWNGSPAPFSVPGPKSVPNPDRTSRRTRIWSQSLLPSTRPCRTPTSLFELVVADPSKLELRESAFER